MTVEVPAALARRRTWLLWKLQTKGKGKKPAKVPFYADGSPRRGALDSDDDLSRLVTYAEARKAASKLKLHVGLAITPGLAFVDLDGHAPGGRPDEFARHWIEQCAGGLVEVSQSGNGLHILGLYDGPPLALVDRGRGLEVYTGGRFCAWTGNLLSAPKRLGKLDKALAAVQTLREAPRAKQSPGRFSGERWDARNVERAVERLRGIDPGCPRETWLRVAMALHDGTHGDDEGLDIFTAWSAGGFHDGRPPDNYASERDCAIVWRSLKPGRGVTKASLFAAFPGAPAASGKPAPAVPRESVSGDGISIETLLDAEPPPRVWRVTGIMGVGAHLLVARPKCGKSYLALQLAKALATGAPFLEHTTTAGEVAYFAAEDDERRLVERVKATRTTSGTRGVTFYTGAALLKLAQAWHALPEEERGAGEPDDWLRAWSSAHPRVQTVIIDTQETFEAIFRLEAMDDARGSVTGGAYRRMRLYDRLALERGLTIILVNHTRKSRGRDIVDFHELINMSQTAVAGVTGSLVLADHPERDAYSDDTRRVLAVRGRDLDSDVTLALERRVDGSGFQSLGAYHEVEQTRAQAQLLAAVEALQEGDAFVGYKELCDELEVTKRALTAMLARIRRSNSTEWKGRKIETKRGRGGGIRLVAK